VRDVIAMYVGPRCRFSVWQRVDLPLLPRHRRPPKKIALGWHSYASRQSNSHWLRWQSLQCSWTSSLELSADGLQTAGLDIQPFSDSRWRRCYLVSV